MTLDNVKTDILERTKREAKGIIKEADKEAKRIEELAQRDIENYKQSLKDNEERIISDYERMKEASWQFSVRKNRFEMESKLLDELKKNISSKLSKLDANTRKEHLTALLKDAQKKLKVARVYCSKSDIGYIKGVQAVSSDISGGLIAENLEGDIRIDYSYETLLRSAFGEKISEIRAKLLK
jgi:V/A-type H+-transporting ATPase subunit E